MALRPLLARLRAALPWGNMPAAQTARRPITQTRFVVVDVETSGLDLRSDRLLSIGAVAVEAGAIHPADSIELVLRQTQESGHDNILLHGIAGGPAASRGVALVQRVRGCGSAGGVSRGF